jgi:glycosyltransferase involved in cell wall biosynthesis
VAHHVTFGNDWFPNALMRLRDVPLVWGPVGGRARFPWALTRYMSRPGIAREMVREGITKMLRAVCRRWVRGSVVVAANHQTADGMRTAAAALFVEPQVAMPPAVETVRRPSPRGARRKALFMARLEVWKGPLLAVEALSHLPSDWDLDVYGEGSERERMIEAARKLGVEDRMHMQGKTSLEGIREALAQADGLLFTSFHDVSPLTVAEAVRVGCPVVCLDTDGPPVLIEGHPGVAVPMTRDAPRKLAEALQQVQPGPASDRWNSERFSASVDEWYRAAAEVGPRRS